MKHMRETVENVLEDLLIIMVAVDFAAVIAACVYFPHFGIWIFKSLCFLGCVIQFVKIVRRLCEG